MCNLTPKDIEKLLKVIIINDAGCWEYQPLLKGYGSLSLDYHPKQRARNLLYEIFYGNPGGNIKYFTICKNKFCVNPEHILFISSDEDRFWSYVNKKSDDMCWEWTGFISKYGYGSIKFKNTLIRAHRLSWMLHYGDIPDGVLVCHKCDNRKCVNPKHLFLGSYLDNNQDRDKKDRAVHQHGELHGRAKLTKLKVDEIRELRKTENLSQYELAKMFSVSRPTIAAILNNRTWRD